MKRIHCSSSPRAIRLISLVLCYALVVTTVFLPLSPSSIVAGAPGSNHPSVSPWNRFGQSPRILSAPRRLLGSLMTLIQGGGPPSVPGPNLPDLDAARQLQPAEPQALPPIPSSQPNPASCEDCDPNHDPISRPGGPYFGSANQAIAFDGTGSRDVDPGDGISEYEWTFGDSPTKVYGATPSHTYQSAGSYTVSLKVTDFNDAHKTASTAASVSAGPNPTPTPAASPTPSPSPAQTNAADFVAQSVPATMTAGQPYSVSVTMRNTGATTWSAAHLYRLGSQNPYNNTNWGESRVYLPTDVSPGAEVTFNFTVRAPFGAQTGQAPVHFQWQMVQDGVVWFGQTHDDVVTVTTLAQVSSLELQPENLATARLDPKNRTGEPGEDLLSGNFNWMLNVLSLPGRAGLNLSLPLSYNSLAAWTKLASQGSSMTFDAERGSPSVGFRLGFPSITGPFSNSQTGKNAYLLNTPAGGHIELRQVASTSVYESADSSYLELLEGGIGTLLLRGPDGSQLAYVKINGEYRCTEIKDRNGNYISIKYDPLHGNANPGSISSIIDTLNRTINFNYDVNLRLQSITQARNGQPHTWATFGYSDREVQPNFEEEDRAEIEVLGLPQNNTISVLTQVSLDDGSRYNFEYTDWGQVYKITHHAADSTSGSPHPLFYVSYNLPLDIGESQNDCPRFTQRLDWAENWNNNNPVATSFQFDEAHQWGQVTASNGSRYKEFFTANYNDWRRGLVTRTEIYAPGNAVPEKTTVTDWTQDDTNVAYPLNPRATGVTVSDANGNRRRTTIDYASFGLPSDAFEWGPMGTDGWTLLRRTHTDYEQSAVYLNRHILGLTKQQFLFGAEDNGQRLYSKVSYEYDAGGEFLQYQGNPVQHDAAHGLSLVQGRGNVTSVRRWDVNHETDMAESTASTVGYNTTGSAIFTRDPVAGHQTTISYSDSFSTNGSDTTTVGFATLAYPTMVTINDPGPISSTVRYNYDLGVVTRTAGPPPAGHQQGAIQTTAYDSAARVKKITNAVNGAYTRFVYPTSQTILNKFTTIQEGEGEAYSATVLDGAGRVRAVAGDFPDSAGDHYSGQFTLYDQQGRAVRSTNPTEMTNTWTAAGDDAGRWISSSQTYDWQGRPLKTTNTDGTTKEASYGGCGCAGGAVVTLTDEGTLVDSDPGPGINNVTKKRQQKIYSDVLGRTAKTEVLDWQGGSVYATAVNNYNARDQVTSLREYQGVEASGVYHETLMTYDGYGRLKTKHTPEQKADPGISGSTDHTTWEYWPDDEVQSITDARGITTSFEYNARHLLKKVNYPQNLPTGIPATANVTYEYDEAGNRSLMSDTSGNIVNYSYDTQSRLESEARQFAGLSGTYTLAYQYTIAGQVKKVSDLSPDANTSISYVHDKVGRLTTVNSTGLGVTAPLASNAKYRASGALKHREYGNGTGMNLLYNSRGMMTQYALSGVKEINGAARAEGSDFQYHADGLVKFTTDHYERSFYSMSAHDKSYQYDHAGRLQAALTGLMANDVLNGSASQFPGPGSYTQTSSFDAWDNLVDREGLYWNEINTIGAQTYDAHNRNVAWSYDADGRLLSMNEPPFNEFPYAATVHNYDAAGRHLRNKQTISRQRFDLPGEPVWTTVTTVDAAYDGDGQQVKRVQTTEKVSHWTTTEGGYYLRSSVLGGLVITEYGGGTPPKSYVYGDGDLIATRDHTGLLWRYNNPVTGDGRETDAQGKLAVAAYLDPGGMDVGATDPANAPHEPGQQPQPMAGAYGAHFPGSMGGSGSCIVDGSELGCGFAYVLMGLGAAQCPDNNCNPRKTKYGLRPLILMMDQGFGFFVRGKKEQKSQNSQKAAPTAPTEAGQKECDDRLADIFGGDGAVFATDRDPATLSAVGARNRDRLSSPGESPVNGHAHLYASPTGAGVAGGNLFTPKGFDPAREARDYYYRESHTHEPANDFDELQNYHRFTYRPGSLQRFGYSGGLTISFIHSGPTNSLGRPFPASATDKPGSVLVGTIGNFGGVDVGGSDSGYVHSHLRFYKADSRGRTGAPIDPRTVFCSRPWILKQKEDLKQLMNKLISVSLVLLSFNTPTTACYSRAPSLEVLSQGQPTGCEYNSAALDVIAQKTQLTELIIVIARLGSNETRPNLNRRRLHNVRTYLVEFLTDPSVRRSSEMIVLAHGERVPGFGRIEFYVGGKLVSTLTMKANADLIAANCSMEPPEAPCSRSMKNFYPCKDKHAHRPRTKH